MHFTAFCLGGGRFFPDTVYNRIQLIIEEDRSQRYISPSVECFEYEVLASGAVCSDISCVRM